MHLQRWVKIGLVILIIDMLLLIGFSLSSESSLRGTSDKVLNKKYDSIDGKVYEVINGEQCYRKCSSPAVPKICTFEFTLEWWSTMNPACGECPFVSEDCYLSECITTGGVKRLLEVINKQLPGPAIHVCENDFVRVKVLNNLQHGTETSIHWHGIHQRGSQFMDGVPYFTQCPIDYKGTFLYEFQAYPAGTHFYHSHSGLQAGDGISGALIVRQPREEDVLSSYYDRDLAEHSMLVQSWWPQTNEDTFLVTMTHLDNSLVEKASLFLINGKADRPKLLLPLNLTLFNDSILYDNYTDYNDSLLSNITITFPVATFNVEQGLKYRFRIVHAGIKNCPIRISFDRHRMTIIASDSGTLEPILVDIIQILPGERYDVIIYAVHPVDSYYIQILGVIASGCAPIEGYALLNYEGYDPLLEPIEPQAKPFPTLLNTYTDAVDQIYHERILFSNLRSFLGEEDIRGQPKHTIYMEVDSTSQELVNDFGVIPFALVNNVSYKAPSRPLFFKTDYGDTSEYCNTESLQRQGVSCTTEDICYCTHIYQIGLDDLVEIVILASDQNSEHPMHLHGNDFYVVSMGFFSSEESEGTTLIDNFKMLDNAGKIERNFERPPIKDTVGVPESGYTIMRFIANNPGWWPFHCHTDVHIELGMMIALIVGDKEDLPKSPAKYPLCGSWFI